MDDLLRLFHLAGLCAAPLRAIASGRKLQLQFGGGSPMQIERVGFTRQGERMDRGARGDAASNKRRVRPGMKEVKAGKEVMEDLELAAIGGAPAARLCGGIGEIALLKAGSEGVI